MIKKTVYDIWTWGMTMVHLPSWTLHATFLAIIWESNIPTNPKQGNSIEENYVMAAVQQDSESIKNLLEKEIILGQVW